MRACLNCGHQTSFGEHLKQFATQSIFHTWACPSCQARLQLNRGRRLLLITLGIVVPNLVFFYFKSEWLGGAIPTWTVYLLFFAGFLLWMSLLLGWDRFELVKQALPQKNE